MFGISIVLLGIAFVALVMIVQIRHFPPKAKLICDAWKAVESTD